MAADQVRADPLAGTVTFLLAGLDPSIPPGVAEAAGAATGTAQRCGDLVRPVVAAHGGVCLEDPEDHAERAVAVFTSAAEAAATALDLQRDLVDDTAPGGPVRMRIALHTGEARLRSGRLYTGGVLQLGRQLCDIAHGGQTLVSAVTASVVVDALPGGAWLVDLGAHRLRDLSRPEHVFELSHAELVSGFPPLRSLDVLANNLPTQFTSFVGRGDELIAVEELLGRQRLVTLTGSGGCGKTRLAVQVAAELAGRWSDGVWWVDLGPVTDASRVAELAASTIGVMVEPVGGPLRALTLHLRDRRLLVCLDNCEHLLDATAELADALLRSCPDVSVLATSREPLGMAGETVWRVPSMVEHEAVSLFAERAAHVRPGFTVDDGDDEAVRTICRRLDGIPLAIELAAAWAGTLTPAQTVAGLDDRFRLLSAGPRGVTARQQTLAASVAWSHDLLDDVDRVVFRRLAVLAGGFTMDAATAVCAAAPIRPDDLLAAVGRLVDKSLVIADRPDNEARYRLLETIRQYAHDRMESAEEVAATRDRHLAHFLALAETAEPELEQADQDAWLARLETEHDNLRAALDWGLSAPDPERGRRLAAALPRLWLLHGHTYDGIAYLQRAIALGPDDVSVLQTRLLVGVSLVGATGGRFDLTVDAAQRGLDLATANDDDRHRGRCLGLLAYINVYMDFTTARALCAQARRYAEAADDAFAIDLSLVLEGLALTNSGKHDDALAVVDTAAGRCRRRGDRILAAFALTGQLEAAFRTGDVRGADRLATEAVRLAEPLGDYFTVGTTISNLAWVKGAMGDIASARRLMRTVVRSVEGADHAVDVPTMAVTLGQLHLWDGDVEGARRWFERAARYAAPFLDNLVVARALPGLAAVHRRLGHPDIAHEVTERALAVTRKLDLPHVLAEALDESAALRAAKDPERAERLHHKALAIRIQHNLRTFYVDSLDALAGDAARVDRHAEAARLYAASDAARARIGYPRPSIDHTEHHTAVTALRTTLGTDPFDAAWSEGAALSLDEAVAYVNRGRGSRGRPPAGWASLTPTELSVVRLAVEGLTNPEVGSRLLVSRNTVKTHLTHIYAKLDVTNRTELAILASTHLDDRARTDQPRAREGDTE